MKNKLMLITLSCLTVSLTQTKTKSVYGPKEVNYVIGQGYTIGGKVIPNVLVDSIRQSNPAALRRAEALARDKALMRNAVAIFEQAAARSEQEARTLLKHAESADLMRRDRLARHARLNDVSQLEANRQLKISAANIQPSSMEQANNIIKHWDNTAKSQQFYRLQATNEARATAIAQKPNGQIAEAFTQAQNNPKPSLILPLNEGVRNAEHGRILNHQLRQEIASNNPAINTGYFSTLTSKVSRLQGQQALLAQRAAAIAAASTPVAAAATQPSVLLPVSQFVKGMPLGGKIGLGVAVVAAGAVACNNYATQTPSTKLDEIDLQIAADNARNSTRLADQHAKNLAQAKLDQAAQQGNVAGVDVAADAIIAQSELKTSSSDVIQAAIKNNIIGHTIKSVEPSEKSDQQSKQPLTKLQWLQENTWNTQPFGIPHGGKVLTTGALAVVAGGISYATYQAYVNRAAIKAYVSSMNPFGDSSEIK